MFFSKKPMVVHHAIMIEHLILRGWRNMQAFKVQNQYLWLTNFVPLFRFCQDLHPTWHLYIKKVCQNLASLLPWSVWNCPLLPPLHLDINKVDQNSHNQPKIISIVCCWKIWNKYSWRFALAELSPLPGSAPTKGKDGGSWNCLWSSDLCKYQWSSDLHKYQ